MTATDAIVVYGFPIEHGSGDEQRCLDFLGDDEEAFEKLQKYNVKLVEHCSDKSPMYILALADAGQRAHRGYPDALKVEEFTGLDRIKSDAVLAKAAKVLGIAHKPGEWILCSYWDQAD